MKNLIQVFYSFLFAALANVLFAFFQEVISPSWLALLLSAVIPAVLLTFTESVLAVLPRRVARLRRRLYPEGRLEGHWAVRLPEFPERPYAYVHVFFNPACGTWCVEGLALAANFQISASWKATSLMLDTATREASYFYDADIAGSPSHGFASIGFFEGFGTGHGYFVERQPEAQSASQEFERMSDEFVRGILRSDRLERTEDARKLIQVYVSSGRTRRS